MKRVVLLLMLGIFAAAAIAAVPYYHRAQETTRQREAYSAYAHTMGYDRPLAFDTKTEAILDSADRVETFRLQGPDEDYDAAEQAMLSQPHPLSLEDHIVIRVGPTQNRAFAEALHAALAQGTSEPDGAQCFEPGVGFRVWKGNVHTDICVCFTCQGVEVTTEDAKHKILYQSLTTLGASRPALLALSKQAFPQDKTVAAVSE